jgi:CheY-like chemotaxis protein
MRILVVDDEAVVRELIHRVLANQGHDIVGERPRSLASRPLRSALGSCHY